MNHPPTRCPTRASSRTLKSEKPKPEEQSPEDHLDMTANPASRKEVPNSKPNRAQERRKQDSPVRGLERIDTQLAELRKPKPTKPRGRKRKKPGK